MPTKPKHKNSAAGSTLIELLISIVAGLIVLAAVTAIASKAIQANSAIIRSARLNQNLGTALQTMVDDIRRTGHDPRVIVIDDPGIFGDPSEDDVAITNTPGSANSDCILYSYDQNEDGVLDAGERFGFRLRLPERAIETRKSCSAANCDTDCNTGIWESLTNTNTVTIVSLAFTSEGSKCQNISNSGYWVTTDDTPDDDLDDSISFPCMLTDPDASNVTYHGPEDKFTPPAIAATLSPTDGERTVETRQVNIILKGKVTRPDEFDNSASVKNLEVSVKLRNDRVCRHIDEDILPVDKSDSVYQVPLCAH